MVHSKVYHSTKSIEFIEWQFQRQQKEINICKSWKVKSIIPMKNITAKDNISRCVVIKHEEKKHRNILNKKIKGTTRSSFLNLWWI